MAARALWDLSGGSGVPNPPDCALVSSLLDCLLPPPGNQTRFASAAAACVGLLQRFPHASLTRVGSDALFGRDVDKRTGGGECRAGTGSPRKTFALARWMQHEIIPYQRQISADGSKPRAEARAWASFLVKLIVSLAQNPCLSNESAQKSNG